MFYETKIGHEALSDNENSFKSAGCLYKLIKILGLIKLFADAHSVTALDMLDILTLFFLTFDHYRHSRELNGRSVINVT